MTTAKPSFPVLNRGNPSAQGLMLALPFYEGTNQATVRDLSGYGNHGTQSNCIWTGSPNGYAAEFNGSSSFINVPDADNLSFGDGTNDKPFSIVANIYLRSDSNNRIVSKGSLNVDGEWLFTVSGGKDLSLWLYDESVPTCYQGRLATVAITAKINTWIQVAATYDGRGGVTASQGIILYTEGAEIASGVANAGTYVAMENLASPVYVARNATSYGNNIISNLNIYDKVLTASEIRQLYNDPFSMYRNYAITQWIGGTVPVVASGPPLGSLMMSGVGR